MEKSRKRVTRTEVTETWELDEQDLIDIISKHMELDKVGNVQIDFNVRQMMFNGVTVRHTLVTEIEG